MRKPSARCLLAVVLVLCVAFASVSQVRALWSTTFIYTQFVLITTAVALDYSVSSWSFSIYNHLTYNATGTPEAKIMFANATSDDREGVLLAMKSDLTTRVYYKVGGTDILLAEDTADYSTGDYYEVSVQSGLLSVYRYENLTDSDVAVIEDFAFSIDIGAVCAMGSSNYVATAGYVNVETSGGLGGASGMTGTLTTWLPIMLEFAIIGMIFGMIRKFGWGVHL